MILVVNLCHEKLHELEFVKPVEDVLRKNDMKFKTKHFLKLSKEDLDRAQKVIICGTALKDNYFIEHWKKFKWIKEFEKPLLGICAGMQLIGKVFGSELKKCSEIGVFEIKILKEDILLKRMKLKRVYELHNFSITLPRGFELLAESEKCIQAIRKNLIYGILFHPEVLNKELISEFAKLEF